MTTPDNILELIDAFRRSKTMFAAVELGIFEGARTADSKALPRLLDACVALGLLEKRDGDYVNTPQSDKYLRSGSPDSLTGYIHYSNQALYPMWAHLEDAVREGTSRWNQTFGIEGGIFSGFFRTEESKREFLKGMHGFGRLSSPAVAAAFDLTRFHRLIDLGGASGHLADAVHERYPQIEAPVFDLPEVASLYPGTIAGDFFTDPLPEADLYSIGAFGAALLGRQCQLQAPLIQQFFDVFPHLRSDPVFEIVRPNNLALPPGAARQRNSLATVTLRPYTWDERRYTNHGKARL